MPSIAEAYAAIPYRGDAFLRTHPRHVAAVAQLHGLALPPIAGWRILDLGCADGGNALAIAEDLPDAEIVAVDLEPGAIARATALADVADVRNASLRAADLTTLDPEELGTFDLVIAHGLLSWVPEDVRRAALRLARAVLRRPTGVLFASFNSGTVRSRLREVLLPQLAELEADPVARLAHARALLSDDAIAGGDSDLLRHVGALRAAPDHLLAHDDLGAHNVALSAAQLQRESGLRVLGDAGLAPFDPDASHRQVLFINGPRPLAAPDPGRLAGLHAGALLDTAGDAFTTPDGATVRTEFAPLRAALEQLAGAWPAATPADGLHAEALLQAAVHGIVKLVREPPQATRTPGARPLARALARAQAARDGQAVNAWHRTIALRPAEAELLAQLDGTHAVRGGALSTLAAAGLIRG